MDDSEQSSVDQLFAIAARQHASGNHDESRTLLDAVLELEPDRPDAFLLLSLVHQALGNTYAELVCLQRLASVMPLDADLLTRLSTLHFDVHQHTQAVDVMRAAVDTAPDDIQLLNHYAHILRITRRRTESLEVFDHVSSLDPQNSCAQFEKALIHLAEGRLIEGWKHFDARHSVDPEYREPVGIPRWRGEPFRNKRLIVTTEGGHGDNVWAARFLGRAGHLGGTISLQVGPALRNLLARVEGVDDFVSVDDCLDGFDLYCPILSLPACLNVEHPRVYAPARLTCRSPADDQFGRLLARAGDRFRVGIIWSGSETYANNHHRAAPLDCFLPLLTVPNTQFFSLQKGPQQHQLRELGCGNLIVDADDDDFSATAALVRELDLIIMTDTAVAHIAGSLGTPVWNLVDFCPYWYFDSPGTCPWYPAMRLFRQSRPGDWRDVFRHVHAELVDATQGNPLHCR